MKTIAPNEWKNQDLQMSESRPGVTANREAVDGITDPLELLSNSTYRILSITAGDHQCLVDLANDRYHSPGDLTPEDLLAVTDKSISTLALLNPRQDELPSEWRKTPSLKWVMGLHFSGDKLISNLHRRSRFKLLRWPPSTIPRMHPATMTLCALLSRQNGATIDEILSESSLSLSETVGFINGAYLARALSIRAFSLDEPDRKAGKPEHIKGLFAKIRARLKRKSS